MFKQIKQPWSVSVIVWKTQKFAIIMLLTLLGVKNSASCEKLKIKKNTEQKMNYSKFWFKSLFIKVSLVVFRLKAHFACLSEYAHG